VGIRSLASSSLDGFQVENSCASDLSQFDRGMAAKWPSYGRRIFEILTVGWLPSGKVLGVKSLVVDRKVKIYGRDSDTC
jgi:hypothetical protein